MITLYRALRADPALAVLTLLLAALCLAPLGQTAILPFIDMPHHVALAGLLGDVVTRQHDAARFFAIDARPMPYWTVYVLLAVAQRALGVYAGAKAVVGLALVGVPLGVMRLALALGKSPRLGLAAFLLAWDYNLYFGWLNHVIGVVLALFLLARLLEVETIRDAASTWLLGAILALTHILPLVFVVVAIGLATLVRPRAIVARGVALVAPAATLLPWVARSLKGPRVDPGLVFDPLEVRLGAVFADTLGGGPVEKASLLAAGVAFLVVLAVPLLLLLVPQAAPRRGRFTAAAIFAAALGLYLLLPLAVTRPVEHWGTYPRFATLALLAALLLPNPRRVALPLFAPVVASMAWTSVTLARELRAFNTELRPFYEAVALVPKGAKVLPLSLDNAFVGARRPMGESIHGYLTARVGGFNPYLFGQETNPIHYRADARLPAPASWGRTGAGFSMASQGQYYDYILVLGSGDPVARAPKGGDHTAVRIYSRGRFRLYRVE